MVARNLGISANNDVKMLEKIGGECAGAVTFLQPGQAPPTLSGEYATLDGGELADKLRQLRRQPLLAGEMHIRLSLAGAQDKIAVRMTDGQLKIPLESAPSTHILKPAISDFDAITINEFICMRLAQAVGLPAATVELGRVEDIEYLLIERYDRTTDPLDGLRRLHQEDFCQALGLVSANKYEDEDGPTIADSVELLRNACTTPALDIIRFVDAIIFNYLIGNNDAHGKNFSLLYLDFPSQRCITKMAPLYDLVSTAYYPELSTMMAMRIGGEANSELILPSHFDKLAGDAKLGKSMIKTRTQELAHLCLSCLSDITPGHADAAKIAEVIRHRCESTIDMFGR
jgi:serine/threonine-protein kinase HipA